MSVKPQHPFYRTVRQITSAMPEQQGQVCDLALLIAAELVFNPVSKRAELLQEHGVGIDTVLDSINRHVPDNGTAENALLRSSLEIMLFRALYDLRHPENDNPRTFVSQVEISPAVMP